MDVPKPRTCIGRPREFDAETALECPTRTSVAASGRPRRCSGPWSPADGGRGFGFTGGHFHDNWGNDNFRKTVPNALVWVTKVDVPEKGVDSNVSKADLDVNLDKK